MPDRVFAPVTLFAVGLLFCGCNDGRFDVAPVRGTVTCEGEPINVGSVTFTPIAEEGGLPGKPAFGVIQQDGSFVLSTYETDDGAVIGKHRVTYVPPGEPGEEGDGEEGEEDAEVALLALPLPKNHPCRNGGTSVAEVEVGAGANDLVIELSGTGVGGEEESDSGEGE